MGAPMSRVVLDTNVVVSALLFTSGRLAWMRHAWQHGQIRPLACKASVDELLRVFAYAKFQLTRQEQQQLLADFLPFAEVVELARPWPSLPACRDQKDQVFLALAQVGAARALITGDKDLLALKDKFAIPIVTPDEWARQQDPS